MSRFDTHELQCGSLFSDTSLGFVSWLGLVDAKLLVSESETSGTNSGGVWVLDIDGTLRDHERYLVLVPPLEDGFGPKAR